MCSFVSGSATSNIQRSSRGSTSRPSTRVLALPHDREDLSSLYGTATVTGDPEILRSFNPGAAVTPILRRSSALNSSSGRPQHRLS